MLDVAARTRHLSCEGLPFRRLQAVQAPDDMQFHPLLQLLEGSLLPAFIADAQGHVLANNPLFSSSIGRTAAGRHWAQTVADEERSRVHHEWDGAKVPAVSFSCISRRPQAGAGGF